MTSFHSPRATGSQIQAPAHALTHLLTHTLAQPLLAGLLALSLTACGGGAGNAGTQGAPPTPVPPVLTQKVADIFVTAEQIGTAEIKSDFGYSGLLPVSQAIAASGKGNILDMLFMTRGSAADDKLQGRLAADVQAQLQRYTTDNRALLVPGIRVVVVDEIFWNPPSQDDSPAVLQRQLDALTTAVELVRKAIPQASIGMTVTPHATFNRPNTVEFVRKAIALVDWVGTDPYWFGDTASIAPLHAWSKGFHALAKAANPRVETWYIAQAYRLPEFDLATFRSYITEELTYASGYDGVLFFGWQYASELDNTSRGALFDADTKRIYQRYLK